MPPVARQQVPTAGLTTRHKSARSLSTIGTGNTRGLGGARRRCSATPALLRHSRAGGNPGTSYVLRRLVPLARRFREGRLCAGMMR